MAYFRGTDGRDKLKGTVGADEIYGLDSGDLLDGREGQNTIHGGEGDDTIRTGSGRDVIYGGPGDDLVVIKGNQSGTYIIGGFGRDSVSLDRADEGTLLSLDYDIDFSLDGADGFESVSVRIRNDTVSVEKSDSDGGQTSDNVDGLSNLGPEGTLRLFGSQGDDEVEVDRTDGPRVIFHAEGNDTFDGGADTYEEIVVAQSTFSSGSDGFQTRPFNEIVVTSSAAGQMSGRITTTGADFDAEETDSYVTRFTGVDLIVGSDGDDILSGSSGDDAFRPGYGNDGFDGGKGRDTVHYDGEGILGAVVDLQARYGSALFASDGLLDDFSGFYGFGSFVFEDQVQYDGLRRVENAVGSANADVLRGSGGANVLDGGAGDDVLNGRQGDDTLIGGDGDDILRGFAGDDAFQFDANDGDDRVFRFEDGKDVILLSDGLTFADVEIVDLGRHALVTFAETSVKLLDFDHSLLGAADFDIA